MSPEKTCKVPNCPNPPDGWGPMCEVHWMSLTVSMRDRVVLSHLVESQFFDKEAAVEAAVSIAIERETQLPLL